MGSFYALFRSHCGCYSEKGRDFGNFSIFACVYIVLCTLHQILLPRSNQGVGNGQVCDLHRRQEKDSSSVWLKKPEGEEPPAGSRPLD